ncbi:MAG: 16S rRNA (cytosine(1402)-N(4))-methyltransferase RsmH [Alphaproteobacteria bacterium]
MNAAPHKPVMLQEVLDYLNPQDGKVYVDGTFGAGGYTRAILEAADCVVVAIDRDETALAAAEALRKLYPSRFHFVQGCFGDVERLIAQAGFERVDGFVLDLGVSSMQLDQPERGFSFRFDGALDMRMGRGDDAQQTAADLVNTMEEEALANVIYQYGEERFSRRVARAIVLRRAERPFAATLDLADVIRKAVPHSKKDKIDPATRTFQALRIAVNDELGELERALVAAENVLCDQGRLVVVTFHSLEDRIVKSFLREKSGSAERVSRYAPPSMVEERGAVSAPFSLLARKAVAPTEAEIASNSRARSAKLRAALRVMSDAECENGKEGAR